MKTPSLRSSALLAALLVAPLAHADTAPPVRMDLVVQDKKGVPIKDLKAEEVEVTEAGVKRPVGTLSLVEPGAAGQKERW